MALLRAASFPSTIGFERIAAVGLVRDTTLAAIQVSIIEHGEYVCASYLTREHLCCISAWSHDTASKRPAVSGFSEPANCL